jgi:berberine-like enzyme
MPCPPMPFVPEERHGELVIMAIVAYAGDTEAGERAIAPLRALAEPVADMVNTMPYSGIYFPEDPDYRPTAAAKTLFMSQVDRRDAELIVQRLAESDAAMRAVQLRALGGAMARVPADATAFAHRSSRIMVNVAAFYQGPEDRPIREAWVDLVASELVQDDPGAYVNFVGDEGEERIRAAYPGSTWDRLAAIKARYDPTNLFRLNQNIPPSLPEAG